MPGQLANDVHSAGSSTFQVLEQGWQHVNTVLNFSVTVGGIKLTVGAVLAAIIVILIALLVSKLLRVALERYTERHKSVNRAAMYTLSRLMHYAFIVLALWLALGAIGIPVSKFAVFFGALGVGLGFGLQAIFNNFVSGLILLFERSLKVGDFVELESGVHGTVHDISIRATRITTNDNIDILVPNSEFVNGRVVNWTLREVSRRMHVKFGVAYGSDKDLVKKAALEAAASLPFTLTQEGSRKPQVWLTGFGDSSLDFELVIWLTAEAVRRPGAVDAAYNWALETALRKYGLEIPFPQRDLHMRSWFGLVEDDAVAATGRSGAARKRAPDAMPASDVKAQSDQADNDAVQEVRRAPEEDEVPPEPEDPEDDAADTHREDAKD